MPTYSGPSGTVEVIDFPKSLFATDNRQTAKTLQMPSSGNSFNVPVEVVEHLAGKLMDARQPRIIAMPGIQPLQSWQRLEPVQIPRPWQIFDFRLLQAPQFETVKIEKSELKLAAKLCVASVVSTVSSTMSVGSVPVV